MAAANSIKVVLFLQIATFGVCFSAIYKTGESDGWMEKGYGFYQNWTRDKHFKPRDIIVFYYDPEEELVRVQDLDSCDPEEAICAYISGSESIAMEEAGHHFYASGTHCKSGHKVDIKVLPLGVEVDTTNSISALTPIPTLNVLKGPPPHSFVMPQYLGIQLLHLLPQIP